MNIQINTINKTITLLEPCNVKNLVDWMEKFFGEEFKEYSITATTYTYVGYYPWYTWPNYVYKDTAVEPIYNMSIL